MTSVDDSLLVPAVPTRLISARRTTQERKCTRHKTKAQMTGHQTGTVCKRSLGTFSRAGLRKNSFGGATRNSAEQHGRRPSSMSRQPRPSKECTHARHSEAMERVLSDSPRTTMEKKKKITGPHHDARERGMEGWGEERKGVIITTPMQRRARSTVLAPALRARQNCCTSRRTEAALAGVEPRKCVLSPLTARVEQTTNEAHLQATSLQSFFFFSFSAENQQFTPHADTKGGGSED